MLHAQAAAQAQADAAEPVVQPGDVVRVTVFRKPELSAEMEVGPDGTLTHPLYRQVHAAGATRAELEQRIRAFLTGYEADPAFVVEPLVRITVGGEVRQPGQAVVPPSFTAFQAVAQAGGQTPTGRLDRVLLYRGGTVRTLDLSHPESEGALLRVRSGDVLAVERRGTTFREILAPLASLVTVGLALANLLKK